MTDLIDMIDWVTLTDWVGLLNYWVAIVLMMAGFYTVIAQHNLTKKVVGLNIFQVAVFVFYITMGKVEGGTAPILGRRPSKSIPTPCPMC